MMYTVEFERNFGIPARRDFFLLTLNARGGKLAQGGEWPKDSFIFV